MYQLLTKVRGLLFGRITTNIADSLIYMAVLWYFNANFHSPLMLSMVFIIASGIDMISFIFGPFIDRVDGRKLLIYGSLYQAFVSAFIAVILFTVSGVQHSMITALVILIGFTISITLSTIIYPLENKMLPQLVDKNELVKVNSLFQASYKSLDLFLNAIGTLLITVVNISNTVIISSVLFAVAAKLYQSIRKLVSNDLPTKDNDHPETLKNEIKEYKNELVDGFLELKKQTELLKLIVPLVGTNLFYGIAMVGLPRFSRFYLSNSAMGYGILLTFSGVGGVIGAAVMSRLSIHDGNRRKFIFYTFLGGGFSWLFLPLLIPYLSWWALIFVLASSIFVSMMNIMFMSYVQNVIPHPVLGRVATINESILSMMIPIGNFVGGILLVYSISVSQYIYAIFTIIFSFFYFPKKRR